ncbi:hypothetical protein C5167_031020 [Papaver somniferum]|uniref:uncharacterized protein LOC113337336 n=1 Tax=Papaver somniferum TaxID=3469 RepID=UPI000E6FC839|nr:uncharacterized protein LOC113337336 [Papaver somniferum]RZC90310.1 hypothetical protein C5167_031020 [Papaver somniferum]
MARANMMGWATMLVVVMALYAGKAEGLFCIDDCAREHAQEKGGSMRQYLWECGVECNSNSGRKYPTSSTVEAKALRTRSFGPSNRVPPMIVQDLHQQFPCNC